MAFKLLMMIFSVLNLGWVIVDIILLQTLC